MLSSNLTLDGVEGVNRVYNTTADKPVLGATRRILLGSTKSEPVYLVLSRKSETLKGGISVDRTLMQIQSTHMVDGVKHLVTTNVTQGVDTAIPDGDSIAIDQFCQLASLFGITIDPEVVQYPTAEAIMRGEQ